MCTYGTHGLTDDAAIIRMYILSPNLQTGRDAGAGGLREGPGPELPHRLHHCRLQPPRRQLPHQAGLPPQVQDDRGQDHPGHRHRHRLGHGPRCVLTNTAKKPKVVGCVICVFNSQSSAPSPCPTHTACVELLKVLQGKPLEAYKDSSNNLGLNMYFLQVRCVASSDRSRAASKQTHTS